MAKAQRRKIGGRRKGKSGLAALTRRLGIGAPSGSHRKPAGTWRRFPRVAVVLALGLLAGAIGLHALNGDEPVSPLAVNAPAGEHEPAGETEQPGIGDLIAALTEPATQADQTAPEPVAAPAPVSTPDPPKAIDLASLGLPAEPSPSSGAWRAHALPPVDAQGRAMIAIVIDDVGVDRANAERAIGLPAPVTLSLMSYADDLPQLAANARAVGHELMLHLPMQPLDPTVNAGTNSLRVDQSPAQLVATLDWALARFDGYIGVNNHMGSAFTREPASMAVILSELHKRGLMFLDSRTVADTTGSAIAARLGLPHLDRDLFLDNDPAPAAIAAQLAELERIAHEKGAAIGIGHPYPSTIEALQRWIPELETRGIVVVPVSTILRKKLGAAG